MTEANLEQTDAAARRRSTLVALTGFALVCLAYGVNLDTPVLWADEAETAAMSRNVLIHGYPAGYDGRNFLTYDNCGQLGVGLVSKRVPWLQYYVGAASLAIFGDSTRGARLLFVIFGALTFFPLRALLRGRVHHPTFVSTLLLLAPQIVLFQRNGRYYPLLILLSVSFLALLYGKRGTPLQRQAGLAGLSILLFHTHPLMAAGFTFAVFLASLATDRPRLPLVATAAGAGALTWALWYVALPGIDEVHTRFVDLLWQDPMRWFEVFARGWAYAWIDFDYSNTLPLLALLSLVGFAAWKRLPELETRLRDPLLAVIAFDFLIETLTTSAVVGAESRHYFALLRYMPHLCLLLGVALALLVRTAVGAGRREAVVLAAIVACNGFALSLWLSPLPERPATLSWWPQVYGEILAPPSDAQAGLLERLRREAHDPDDVVYVTPRHLGDVLTFYVGDELLVSPYVEAGSACEDEIVRTVGRAAWSRSTATPRFVVAFERDEVDDLPGYDKLLTNSLGRRTPTATRPALNRRSFYDADLTTGKLMLYRAQQAKPADVAVERARRGIVLITLDTARGDLFDWGDAETFPHIKSLFANGSRFAQAISASPVTGPAHASLFTGLTAFDHGVLSNHLPLGGEHTTVAETLQRHGYRTGAFVSASILAKGRGFDRGFEHYDDRFDARYAEGHYERDAMRTTERAIAWLEAADTRPFFVWVHYFDAHAPYAPPADYRPEGYDDLSRDDAGFPDIETLQRIHHNGRALPSRQHDYYRALYRAQLAFVDGQIARLREAIDRRFPEATIHYALTADHGEELGDHMNFYEHNLSLYDGVLRVPLAIAGPGVPQEHVAEQVDPAGLAATLIELAGAPQPEGIAADLLDPQARGVERIATKELHAAVRPWAVTLRAPPWKYIYWEDGREELYDLSADPAERDNRAVEQQTIRAQLRARVEQEVLPQLRSPETQKRLEVDIEVDVDPATRDMLRTLGYL